MTESLKALAAAPSYLTPIPHRSAQLEEIWAYLYDGLEHIMLKPQQSHGLSFTAYTNLYTTVYNYCTSCQMDTKPAGNNGTRHAPSVTLYLIFTMLLAGTSLVGSALYSKLSAYFIEHFNPMIKV